MDVPILYLLLKSLPWCKEVVFGLVFCWFFFNQLLVRWIKFVLFYVHKYKVHGFCGSVLSNY